MARKRVFKGGRKPQYQVITSCKPEQIDAVSLKLRDIQILYFIMLDYTTRYIGSIEATQERCEDVLDLHAPVKPGARALEDQIRIMFTAAVAAFESAIDYLKKMMRRAKCADGLSWIENKERNQPLLSAFDRLRAMDLHSEPMNTLIGMRYRVFGLKDLHSDIKTQMAHFHYSLAHEGVGFFPWALEKTQQFSAQPGLVEFVTFESVLQLTHTSIHGLIDLVDEAVAKSYIPEPTHQRLCQVCEDAKLSDSTGTTASSDE